MGECEALVVVPSGEPQNLLSLAQLEHRLELERQQRGEVEKSRRRLEGDSLSTLESLGEMEKRRGGLEDILKRCVPGEFIMVKGPIKECCVKIAD